MKTILISLTFLTLFSGLHSQVLFEENFEGGSIPAGWINETNASDGGWKVGTASSLSSQFFPIPSNGSANIAATNDDDCNCNKRDEYFISPAIDLSTVTSAVLRFDAFYTDQTEQGIQENARIEVSLDGSNWTLLDDLHGHGSWDRHSIDISDYAGDSAVYIGFYYTDGGGWLYGFGIDNMIVEVPPTIDAEMTSSESAIFGEVNKAHPIKFTIYNNGIETITSINMSYAVDGGAPVIDLIDNLNIPAFEYAMLEADADWIPSGSGTHTIDIIVDQVNGVVDEIANNNTVQIEVTVFDEVIVPNKITELLADDPEIEIVSNPSGSLNKPTDLDFFPIYGKNELWVINERTESSGGSTLKISDATTDAPSFLHQVDGNAWHFMSLPTGIAFSSDNFNFASSPGVQDANHSGGTFTGPTLWSSDPDIYAQPSGGNGSHLDMLHGSPKSMGIAHEVDNVFWVYDNWNKDIVRYDFVEDHGPGNDDHADAIVRRYKNIGISAQGDIPNHMVLDKNSGWLYFVDNGNNRVLRLDINSGSVTNQLPLINEPLAEHSQVGGFVLETVADGNLTTPCGIELFENYLMVGEYFSGDIVVYDVLNDFIEIGRIPTINSGLTGIKVGPDGNIWFTNRLRNELAIASPSGISGVANKEELKFVNLFPNPTTGNLSLSQYTNIGTDDIDMTVYSINGKEVLSQKNITSTIDLSELNAGIYTMTFISDQYIQQEQVIIQR
jgi:hypothetical protein